MKRLKKAVRLSTLCFLAASGCGEKAVVKALPIPADRMDCIAAGQRPAIPPEYAIDWKRVESALTVPQAVSAARSEVQQFVGSVRTREGTVAGYVLDLEGQLFACSNDAQWLREWQKAVAL